MRGRPGRKLEEAVGRDRAWKVDRADPRRPKARPVGQDKVRVVERPDMTPSHIVEDDKLNRGTPQSDVPGEKEPGDPPTSPDPGPSITCFGHKDADNAVNHALERV